METKNVDLKNLTEEDILEKIYQLALSSKDEDIQLKAWLALITHKKEIATKLACKKDFGQMLDLFAKMQET